MPYKHPKSIFLEQYIKDATKSQGALKIPKEMSKTFMVKDKVEQRMMFNKKILYSDKYCKATSIRHSVSPKLVRPKQRKLI
jgi:hypothetical protein